MNTPTTEPTTTQPPAPPANGAPSTAITKPLSPAAEAWALRQREANAISKSTLLPQTYQDNLPNVLIAMEIAERIGASIFMVAQNLDVIHGRPGWRSTFLIATVNASKRFSPLRFRFQGTPGKDDYGCRAVAKDLSDSEPCVGPLITIGLAKAEGWYDRKGSKWQTLPELMLHYRAAAFWTRIFAPELSLGIRTSEEEADILDAAPGSYSVTVEPPKDVKALEEQLRAQPAAAVETKPDPSILPPELKSMLETIDALKTLDEALAFAPELLKVTSTAPADVAKALRTRLAEKRKALGEPQ
jgi:hypothetical protein